MSRLSELSCKHNEPGSAPLVTTEVIKLSEEVPTWSLSTTVAATSRLHREFKFKDFRESIEFVKKVADIAEQEAHHPDIFIFYNVVRLDLSTHSVNGLSENDFIVAAKIDALNGK
jgi:4a-hydroxytetrahydrobiopterin dehydratase